MTMTLAELLAQVDLRMPRSETPAITDPDVEAVAALHRCPDDDGRLVSDAAWEESYDLWAIMAELWRIRADRLWSLIDADAGPNRQKLTGRRVYAESRAAYYRSRLAVSFDPGAVETDPTDYTL